MGVSRVVAKTIRVRNKRTGLDYTAKYDLHERLNTITTKIKIIKFQFKVKYGYNFITLYVTLMICASIIRVMDCCDLVLYLIYYGWRANLTRTYVPKALRVRTVRCRKGQRMEKSDRPFIGKKNDKIRNGVPNISH